tara:strand:+ start:4169 stop:4387 length:219 start_codon:yes stop_codon:yes gene_type:complete
MAKNSSKRGYGAHNVARKKISRRDINKLSKKSWGDVSSMDLYILFNEGWKLEKLSNTYKVSMNQILNRLRFS